MNAFEEIARTYDPANGLERMLLAQLSQSWERLERAHELERQYFKNRDIAEIIRTKLDEFKTVTRYLTDCERAWRHALLLLEKAQRRRQRETAKSEPARRTAPTPEPAPLPRVHAAPAADVHYAHRE